VHVVGRLWQCKEEITQFQAGDVTGRTAIKKVELLKNNIVRLTMIRELGEGAKVWNCAGHNPEVCLLDSADRPILSFSEIPVTQSLPVKINASDVLLNSQIG